MNHITAALAIALAACGVSILSAQRSEPLSIGHPAIEYMTRPPADPVASLNRRIESGEIKLRFDSVSGYLRSVLEALRVPIESQVLVYSPTSVQSLYITQRNPRALFFNDEVAVGWVKGTHSLEISAVDPRQGAIFYQLAQIQDGHPEFVRTPQCLQCHQSDDTAGVPGLLTMSMLPLSKDPNEYAVGWAVDHRTPLADRWGGWYVTGTSVPDVHLGNVPVLNAEKGGQRAARAPKLASVNDAVDSAAYLVPSSDIVALMVLNHQTRMTNLLTRMNWVARMVERDVRRVLPDTPGSRVQKDPAYAVNDIHTLVEELVDYLLFVDEEVLSSRIEGSSGFAGKFAATGPRDGKGRSLREFDLQRRLFRYRCSYMIYSPAFEALPSVARDLVYRRMRQVLAGELAEERYRMPLADRQAIAEILIATKEGIPRYFREPILK